MDETKLFWITENRYENNFPAISDALTDPDGLLAAGGDLSVSRLLIAYRNGIFPWYSQDQPFLWWSPDPRTVFYPDQIHISRSLKKTINKNLFTMTFDTAFEDVIFKCSEPRYDDKGTWLSSEMIEAYTSLHKNGHAHSIECWQDNKLVGGLYGVAVGRVFFGESMFSRVTDASKICLAELSEYLQKWNYALMDCQVDSDHLRRMGACQISRDKFKLLLDEHCPLEPSKDAWIKK